jgi:hypothetical protein
MTIQEIQPIAVDGVAGYAATFETLQLFPALNRILRHV